MPKNQTGTKKGRPSKRASDQVRRDKHKKISAKARYNEREKIQALKSVLPEIRDQPKCNKARVLKCSANAIINMNEQVTTLRTRIEILKKEINDIKNNQQKSTSFVRDVQYTVVEWRRCGNKEPAIYLLLSYHFPATPQIQPRLF